MEFLMRALFLIAAVSFFIFRLTLVFSIFLIVWPFIAYAWLSQRIKPRDGTGPTQTTIYKSEKSIVIEHEDKKED
jgi:hypothetical protein